MVQDNEGGVYTVKTLTVAFSEEYMAQEKGRGTRWYLVSLKMDEGRMGKMQQHPPATQGCCSHLPLGCLRARVYLT